MRPSVTARDEPGEGDAELPGELTEEWVPAGPLRRIIATLIDMVLLCGLCTLIALPAVQAIDWSRAADVGFDELARVLLQPVWSARAAGVIGMWIAVWLAYFIVGWGLLGGTPGKLLLKLRVADHRRRCPIGPTRALLRLVAYCTSSLTLGIGHLVLALRGDRRTLHDVLAGTLVLRRSRRRRLNPDSKN